MRTKVDVSLQKKDATKLKAGYPLIEKKALSSQALNASEGAVLYVHDENNYYIGTGYYGKQNKGIGWIVSYNPSEEIDDQVFFQKKFQAAFEKRNDYFDQAETTAFRLFNGEGDGIGGLSIDYFSGYLVINWYSEGIYSFKQNILKALDSIGEFQGIYEKKRFDHKGKYMEDDDFIKGTEAPAPLIIKENNIQYAVYLNDGAMVGIFLDQKDVRKLIRDKYANGKTVLNTFSYTGAFSVAAALGGATTVSVDLAKRSDEKTKEQFILNGLNPEEHEIRVMDVFDYFKYAKRKSIQYDMVILDPPSFARSKKHVFRSAKDYPKLLQQAIEITKDKGIIVASTNNASFSMKKFQQFIKEAFEQTNQTFKIHEERSLPKDFVYCKEYKESNYLKVVVIEVLAK